MLRCPECKLEGFASIASERSHRRDVHSDLVVTCDCGRSFLRKEYMAQHIKHSRKHMGLMHQKTNLHHVGSHRRDVHSNLGVTCECGRSFLKNEYMTQHIRQSRKHKSRMHQKTNLYHVAHSGNGASASSHESLFPSGNSFGLGSGAGASSRENLFSSAKSVGSGSSLSQAFAGLSLSASPSDIYNLNSNDLEKYIADNIQADASFRGCCGNIIDTLVRKLQENGRLIPRKIIKSGSMGKGTANKDGSDIDLILMLDKYDDVDNLMGNMSGILGGLQTYLDSYTTARHQRTTGYSVQVEMTCLNGHKHDVDILPAVDLLGQGNSPRGVYDMMENVLGRTMHEYSVSLAPLQLEMFSVLPAKVKSLIRLVKYWKNKKLKGVDEHEMPSFAEKRYGEPNWPSSYALELVVIDAWKKAGGFSDFDMTKVLQAVLTSLVNHRQLKIVLDNYMKYDISLVSSRHAPYIMDPVNPYNDMYHGRVGGQAFDWDLVATEARRWLSKPLFQS